MKQTRLQALQQFLEQDPHDSFTRYAIAMEYVSMKNSELALQQLRELIASDPTYVPAYHQMGLLFAHTGNIDESITIFKQGIQVAQHIGDTHAQQEMQDALDEIEDEM